MNTRQATHHSKFLSLVLRHKPETIGLLLDGQGWAGVPDLLQKLTAHGHPLQLEELIELVRSNPKQRFAFNEDGTRIRASQGHSIDIELGLASQPPPEYLYHGTIAAALQGIHVEGLKSMSRQHVHLSKDRETARAVGQRHGKAVILTIRSGAMFREGKPFYVSANGVWLTDKVPPGYINFDMQAHPDPQT